MSIVHGRAVACVCSGILLAVMCEKLLSTSRIRQSPWPDLRHACDVVDLIHDRLKSESVDAVVDAVHQINQALDALLKRIHQFGAKRLKMENSRMKGLVRSINSCDAVERECLVKILGIPGLSRQYYMEVMHQLAQHIGVPFRETDIVMLKRLNAQPNFVLTPEKVISNVTYPIFLRFTNQEQKDTFLRLYDLVHYERRDPNFLNKMFDTDITLDRMESTELKLQIHGFRTMNVPFLYKLMDKLCNVLKYNHWRSNIVTIYQTRYTKNFDSTGTEQLQTDGIIVKLRNRKVKFDWMRQTRLKMLKRPKDERKIGFNIHLQRHAKYRDRNFTVYIDEHLSTHKKNLFLVARGRCQIMNWLHCWTWDGHVYVRKGVNSSTIRVDTFEDIDKYIH
ncbi:hypothetical protein M8J76_014566 [Diaphorina citri]|nr:hypothetical protein M8J76_014566 [Diaphorina citri]